jgi:hypothetical protein
MATSTQSEGDIDVNPSFTTENSQRKGFVLSVSVSSVI